MAKHSSGTNDTFAVDEEVVAEDVDKSSGIRNFAAWGDSGVQCGRDRLPAVFFQNLDYRGRLWMPLAGDQVNGNPCTNLEVDVL